MKAEHRKELERNTLAEGMGQLVRRMKDRPRRATFSWVVVALAFGLGLLLVWRWFYMSRLENAENWYLLENGSERALDKLITEAPQSNPGKAAQLEQSWLMFWELGMKGIGHAQPDKMKPFNDAYKKYQEVAERAENDPTMEPEALYGMAVIEETKALLDRKYLDTARAQYEKLAQKYEKTAFGKLAGQRVAALKDERQRAELQNFYQNLSAQLGLDRPAVAPELPKGILDLKPAEPKAKPPEAQGK